MLLRNSYKALVAGLFLLVCQNNFAEQIPNDQKANKLDHLSIPYANKKIAIDGNITDDEWSRTRSYSAAQV